MTEAFDPYRKWLGIPAQDQPPHHYRLLGLELFEADADVISNAVDGRMTQIKTFQAGKYSAYSQKILNEIAAARVCLLNAAKKEEYDRQLREQGVGATPAAPIAAMPPPSPLDGLYEEAPPLIAASDFPPTQSDLCASYRKRKGSPWIIPLILTAFLLVIGTLVVVLLKRDTKELDLPLTETPPEQSALELAKKEAEEKAAKKETAAKELAKKEAAKKELAKKEAAKKEIEKATVKKPEPTTPKIEPKETVSAETPMSTPVQPEPVLTPNEKDEKDKSKEKESDKTTDLADSLDLKKKPAPPDEDAQREAEKKIREIFGKDIAGKTVEQKLEILKKFVEQGEDTANDVVTRYVFLRMGRDFAVSLGESAEVLKIIDTLAKDFDLGKDAAGLTMKADALTKLWESHRGKPATPEAAQQFFAAVKTLTDDALNDDDYETALRACKLSVRAAARDPQLSRDMIARQAEVTQLKAKFTVIRKALDALADDPNDAAANLTVGRWRCLSKDDWDKGLPHLAKSDIALLAAAAKKELSDPKEAKDQLSLADAWWEAADKESVPAAKHALRSHAGTWYEKALPELGGIDKTKAEKRLEDIGKSPEVVEVPKAKSRGIVQKGNVALASNGTTVTSTGEITNPERLLDGNITKYANRGSFTFSNWPCEWTITFRKTYQLREIRFLLWDLDARYYRYTIAISNDGKNFKPLIDHSKGEWKSWQTLEFSPRPVKAIKLIGLYGSASNTICVVEFEAYCTPSTSSSKSSLLPPDRRH